MKARRVVRCSPGERTADDHAASDYIDHLVAGGPPVVSDDLHHPGVRILRALRHFDEASFEQLADALDLAEDKNLHVSYQRALQSLVDDKRVVRLAGAAWRERSGVSRTADTYRIARKP